MVLLFVAIRECKKALNSPYWLSLFLTSEHSAPWSTFRLFLRAKSPFPSAENSMTAFILKFGGEMKSCEANLKATQNFVEGLI